MIEINDLQLFTQRASLRYQQGIWIRLLSELQKQNNYVVQT